MYNMNDSVGQDGQKVSQQNLSYFYQKKKQIVKIKRFEAKKNHFD